MNFAKFLRTPFPTEHLRWLLLDCILRSEYTPTTKYLTKTKKPVTDDSKVNFSGLEVSLLNK